MLSGLVSIDDLSVLNIKAALRLLLKSTSLQVEELSFERTVVLDLSDGIGRKFLNLGTGPDFRIAHGTIVGNVLADNAVNLLCPGQGEGGGICRLPIAPERHTLQFVGLDVLRQQIDVTVGAVGILSEQNVFVGCLLELLLRSGRVGVAYCGES